MIPTPGEAPYFHVLARFTPDARAIAGQFPTDRIGAALLAVLRVSIGCEALASGTGF
jgi:hypothetical protein